MRERTHYYKHSYTRAHACACVCLYQLLARSTERSVEFFCVLRPQVFPVLRLHPFCVPFFNTWRPIKNIIILRGSCYYYARKRRS